MPCQGRSARASGVTHEPQRPSGARLKLLPPSRTSRVTTTLHRDADPSRRGTKGRNEFVLPASPGQRLAEPGAEARPGPVRDATASRVGIKCRPSGPEQCLASRWVGMAREPRKLGADRTSGTEETAAPLNPGRLTFTVDEVAALLGLSRSAVYDCIARGELPAKRLGRRVLVVRAALEAFLAEPETPQRPARRPVRSRTRRGEGAGDRRRGRRRGG